MTKKSLILLIADRLPENTLKKLHIETIVETTLEVFIASLAETGRIEIRDFVVFTVKRTPKRPGRNPVTGAEAIIPERNYVQFKAGKEMKEKAWIGIETGAESPGHSHGPRGIPGPERNSSVGKVGTDLKRK